MSYESTAPTISVGGQAALHLYTTYRDEEVGSVADLVRSNGRECQAWIDAPDQSGTVQVSMCGTTRSGGRIVKQQWLI